MFKNGASNRSELSRQIVGKSNPVSDIDMNGTAHRLGSALAQSLPMVFKRWRHAQQGYSLIEMMIVVGVMGVVTGIAVLQVGSSKQAFAGDGAMRVVLAQLTQARELAITQRRNIRVAFAGTSVVQTVSGRSARPGPDHAVPDPLRAGPQVPHRHRTAGHA